jgi:hypothetical protein
MGCFYVLSSTVVLLTGKRLNTFTPTNSTIWFIRFEKFQTAEYGRASGQKAKWKDMIVEEVDFQHRHNAYHRFAVDNPKDPAACVINKAIILKPDTPPEVCRDIGFRINKDRDINMVKNEASDQWKYVRFSLLLVFLLLTWLLVTQKAYPCNPH